MADPTANRRSEVQIAADDADLYLYRLASKLDGMAANYRCDDFKRAADIVASARSHVRQHMHQSDLEVTYGS